jgi:hypothetical protein
LLSLPLVGQSHAALLLLLLLSLLTLLQGC